MATEVSSALTENVVAPSLPSANIEKVIVHPLVLLSVVDHFSRMHKVGIGKRVVGCLLGSARGNVLDISNSFAVPFDEDERDPTVWFLDHDYLENMFSMFRKVNARERIVGWYHTGPKLRGNDIAINDLVRNYCPNSVLCVIDVQPKQMGLPTEAYIAVEQVHDDGTPTTRTFEHVPSEIGAEEAEEVGVEHLLRDIRESTIGTLSQRITDQLLGLRGLRDQLVKIHTYLEQVRTGVLPVDHNIVYVLQDIFNLLPDVTFPSLVNSLQLTTNDEMLAIYMSALLRSVIALHNLINNQLQNRDTEKKEQESVTGKGKEKEKENKEKDDKEKPKDDKENKGKESKDSGSAKKSK